LQATTGFGITDVSLLLLVSGDTETAVVCLCG